MITVGLTGGIGSGKTLIAGIFNKLGAPVFEADREAKIILNKDKEIHRLLRDLWGDQVFKAGQPDRQEIAKRVFRQPDKLHELNASIHPKVRKLFTEWSIRNSGSAYVLMEAAILFETGQYKNLDLNILVITPENIRINRVMKRDGSSEKEVKKRIQNQLTDDIKKTLADFIIDNPGDRMILPQVIDIHEQIQKRANG